jgi:hypothetical protein
MKKCSIFLFILGTVAFSSCKKNSFLNLNPLSSISPENFFASEADLQLYCNQYYANLPVQIFSKADDQSDDKANITLNTFLAGTSTIPTSTDGTGWNFSNIRTYNFFLANYQKSNLGDSIENIYVGETLFFRALNYFQLVQQYGDVQYIDKYIVDTSVTALYSARVPHKQVMDSVLSDINFAVAHLPLPSQAASGRLNKYQALALKARICLWEGTYREYWNAGDQTPYLQAAADAAAQIMSSGLYHLYTTGSPQTDYYNLFAQYNLQSNPEAIMAMAQSANVLMNNDDRDLGQWGDGYSKAFVRSYLCTDGLPTALSPLYKGDDSLQQEILNRDPRFGQSIATRGFDFLGTDTITLPRIGTSVTSTGYEPIKGRTGNIADWNASQSVLGHFIFRYAETLLIDAEARAELGTCTQGTIDSTINKLRDRVGMAHMVIASLVKDPNSLFPALPVLIDEIRRERRIELSAEGFRYNDLQRWKAGTLINNPEAILGIKLLPSVKAEYPPSQVSSIVVNSNNYVEVYPSMTNLTWNDKMYLNPIPIEELTLNPKLSQNPGW